MSQTMERGITYGTGALGDHLGTANVVLDHGSGKLIERNTAYAYGAAESIYRTDEGDGFREDYRFTGKEDDVEVGLIYFGQRYYAPLLQRWISPDPLAVHAPGKADLNVYAYVHGRVLVAVDPVGLDYDATVQGSSVTVNAVYYLPATTTDVQMSQVEKVVNQYFGGQVKYSNEKNDYDVRFSLALRRTEQSGHLPTGSNTISFEDAPSGAAGANAGDNKISVPKASVDARPWVLGHEIGHSLGLDHRPALGTETVREANRRYEGNEGQGSLKVGNVRTAGAAPLPEQANARKMVGGIDARRDSEWSAALQAGSRQGVGSVMEFTTVGPSDRNKVVTQADVDQVVGGAIATYEDVKAGNATSGDAWNSGNKSGTDEH